tara:strand:- start:9645 stop:10217 length:573 start_codon:yes stop_codon:yes gene_type:complete
MSRKKQLFEAKKVLRDQAAKREKSMLKHLSQALRPDGSMDCEQHERLLAEWHAKYPDNPADLLAKNNTGSVLNVLDADLYSSYSAGNVGNHRTRKRGITWTEEGRSYVPTSQKEQTQIDPSLVAEGGLSIVSRDISRWEMKEANISLKKGSMVMIVSGEYDYHDKVCVSVMCDGQVFAGVPGKTLRPMKE